MEYVHLVSVEHGVHTLLYHGRYFIARGIADEVKPWSRNLFLMDIRTMEIKVIKGCKGSEISEYTEHIQRISRKKSERSGTKKRDKEALKQSKKQSAKNEQAKTQIHTVSDSDPKFTGQWTADDNGECIYEIARKQAKTIDCANESWRLFGESSDNS